MSVTTHTTHPVISCVQRLGSTLAEVAGVQAVFMSTADKEAALTELARLERQLAELRLRILASADDVAAEHGARDISAWLAHRTQAEPRETRADLELARALDDRCPVVAAGMAEGAVSTGQARVIVDALDALRGETDPDTLARAEAHLVAYAEQFRPGQLRRLGRRILEVVAPEAADDHEAKRLAAEERHAQKTARLWFRPLGDGTTQVTGLLPDPVAARLKTYLEAYTNPRQPATNIDDAADRRPQSKKYADAFAALLEHLDPKDLPEHGGDATTVLVTVTLDQLRTDLASAGLLDADLAEGNNLTAAEARRLACAAHLIPIVLGGDSEILDQGRAKRLHTPAQRKAIRLRDQRCRAEGCTIPAPWCEVHHLDPWSAGGRTDLANAISLCHHHHHRAHDTGYRIDRLPNGDIRFHRRA
jgi:hypothetical protein